jgi:hypothetical protein
MGDDLTPPEPPPPEPPPPRVAAGWLDDPEQFGMYRYWDGAQWTDNRSPKPHTPPPSPEPAPLPKRKPQSERFAALPTIQKVGIIGVLALAVVVFWLATNWNEYNF